MNKSVVRALLLTVLTVCFVAVFGEAIAAEGGVEMDGLDFVLGEGEAPASPPAVPLAPGRDLSPEEADRLLNRLPALEAGEEAKPFAFPPESPPPPRPGRTIDQPFPPLDDLAAQAGPVAGPVEVVRKSPEGDVPLAPKLSVTFSQPMVELTSLEDQAAKDVPVRLTPETPGRWRWIGTKTLVFEPEVRFPMATRFQAEIPQGVKSPLGGTLEAPVAWAFTTPPPKMESAYPQGNEPPQPLNPVIFAAFDQRIDPDKLLPFVSVTAGGKTQPVRLAAKEEIDADATIKSMAENAVAGRWLAFRPQQSLPGDAAVTVTIKAGAPSAEGPLTTTAAQTFSFRTFGPLEPTGIRCAWYDLCPPMVPWELEFTNPLDENAFDPALVAIEPALPDARMHVDYNRLVIAGLSKGRTTYRITVKSGLKDVFGQTLAHDAKTSIKIGSSPPMAAVPRSVFYTMDPSAKPAQSVYTINYEKLEVLIHRVQPEDYPAYMAFLSQYGDDTPQLAPGRKVFQGVLKIKAEPDVLTETVIDLAPYMENGLGHVIVEVKPKLGLFEKLFKDREQYLETIHTWVQSTRIGLDALSDTKVAAVWANSLTDGAPLEGVAVSIHPGGGESSTGPDGLARLPLPEAAGAVVILARKGGDTAILRKGESYYGGESWQAGTVADQLRWYVFDDRKMYRPGEEVRFKGWIRKIGAGPSGDVSALDASVKTAGYSLIGPQNEELANGTVKLNSFGGFDLAYTLPDNVNLGDALLRLRAENASGVENPDYDHYFQVQEFRRPEFEVGASAPEGPFFAREKAVVTVEAKYFAGGGLPNADVHWNVTTAPGAFTPPGWDEFIFGQWTPWWWGGGDEGDYVSKSFEGRTDGSGKHRLLIDFMEARPPRPYTITAEAQVMDVNRQAWTAEQHLLVHPGELYVGLKPGRVFVEPGKPYPLAVVVADLDGETVPGRAVKLNAVRLEWVKSSGGWHEEEVDPVVLSLVSAAEPVEKTFNFKKGGQYRISAEVSDDAGRPNLTEMTAWVSGGQVPAAMGVEQEKVDLIPDKNEYRPGDTAELLVQAPFFPAEGLVSLQRSGLIETRRFRMDGPSHTLKVLIDEKYLPNLVVKVDLVGAAPRADKDGKPAKDAPSRPAFASGEINLTIPPYARTLSLAVTPKTKRLEPGAETSVDVLLKDDRGEPVRDAEVALFVVDEAILALTGYDLADPVGVFYGERPGEVEDRHSRRDVLLADIESLKNRMADALTAEAADRSMAKGAMMPESMAVPSPAMEGAGGGYGADGGEPIRVREDFRPLAVFAPTLRTDGQGRAVVPFKMPDSLSRYRVMAVAVAGDKRFGKGESTITARLPLMVRPSAPRFLRFGDRFELPVVLQNQTDTPMEVDVAVRAVNLELTAGAGKRVNVPANDRIEVRFPAAAVQAGTAKFQVGAASGKSVDAALVELPVWTPATTEAAAVYGELDEGAAAQPLAPPKNVFPQFGGLDVTASSTALQSLTDAALYLIAYPFECSEQLASRILSVAALGEVLAEFNAEGLPSPNELKKSVARDVERLQGMQNYDGGFPVWQRGRDSWPYHTIHVAHALVRAKAKGFEVPEQMMGQALLYLGEIEGRIPEVYGPEARRSLRAYALYVLALAGQANREAASGLIREAGPDGLTLEAAGWLLSALTMTSGAAPGDLETLRRFINNRAEETAGTAQFVTSYGDDGYLMLHSDRRADAVVLEALILDRPESDLIPKVVRGLQAHREKGRWDNTQENVFILLALEKYFKQYEAQTPDFTARIWLGERFAGGLEFKGRKADYQRIQIPMSELVKGGPQNILLTKEGAGRLYYRLGLRYAPENMKLKPADYGFAVERKYEGADDPADARQDADGTWNVKAGARVKITLTMVAPARRYHVALIDPLPAGFEALNPALAVTGSLPPSEEGVAPSPFWWWWRPWYEHENLRDDRAEAFTPLLWDGVHTYTYYARATTPGRFIAAPAKAEEMYAPETFGRSGTEIVVVE